MEFIKMNNIFFHILNISFGYILVIRSIFALNFNVVTTGQCGDINYVFLRLRGISVRNCTIECIIRPKCSSINYRRSFPLCELIEEIDSAVQVRGCLNLKKIYMNSTAVAEYECQHGQRWDADRHACIHSECDKIESSKNVEVYGNMYTIGSVLRIINSTKKKENANEQAVTCLPNGQWGQQITGCPSNWVQFNGRCFYFSEYTDGYKTVFNAMEYCESFGSHLVRVDTEETSNYITGQLSEKFSGFLAMFYTSTNYWIGLEKLNGTWVWMDNRQPLGYTNWGDHQPGSIEDENYVFIQVRDNCKWHDITQTWPNRWICEKALR